MNHHDDNHHDDLIEVLLRKQFEGGIADDGFSERMMQRLPPRRSRIAWPLWLGLLAGADACWLSVAGLPWTRVSWRYWTDGSLLTSTIGLLLAMAGMSLLACWWSIAEADDR